MYKHRWWILGYCTEINRTALAYRAYRRNREKPESMKRCYQNSSASQNVPIQGRNWAKCRDKGQEE